MNNLERQNIYGPFCCYIPQIKLVKVNKKRIASRKEKKKLDLLRSANALLKDKLYMDQFSIKFLTLLLRT